MNRFRVGLVGLLLLAAAGSACAEAAGDPMVNIQQASDQAQLSEELLVEAGTAAKAYGRRHLGHYLELRKKHLIRGGLSIPRGFSLHVGAAHTSYCVRITNNNLPSIHPWRVGTISSATSGPAIADRCTR